MQQLEPILAVFDIKACGEILRSMASFCIWLTALIKASLGFSTNIRPCEGFAGMSTTPCKSELHKINAAFDFEILNTVSRPLDEQKERSSSVASSNEETPVTLLAVPSRV
jgi:hypothetical protein